MEGHELTVPLRRDGTPKAFWYHPESNHVIYRRRDGSLEAFGFECRHEVEEIQ